MKLKELHPDMERYLKESCYCPGEIYSADGFFCLIYENDTEIVSLGSGLNSTYGNIIACVEGQHNQILIFVLDSTSTRVIDALRCDATDENIEVVKNFMANKTNRLSLNSFNPEAEAKALKKLLSMSNVVMYS